MFYVWDHKYFNLTYVFVAFVLIPWVDMAYCANCKVENTQDILRSMILLEEVSQQLIFNQDLNQLVCGGKMVNVLMCDLTLFPHKHGKGLLWDVTCLDTLADSYIKLTSKTLGIFSSREQKRHSLG